MAGLLNGTVKATQPNRALFLDATVLFCTWLVLLILFVLRF